jgi:hypothetical protein
LLVALAIVTRALVSANTRKGSDERSRGLDQRAVPSAGRIKLVSRIGQYLSRTRSRRTEMTADHLGELEPPPVLRPVSGHKWTVS